MQFGNSVKRFVFDLTKISFLKRLISIPGVPKRYTNFIKRNLKLMTFVNNM